MGKKQQIFSLLLHFFSIYIILVLSADIFFGSIVFSRTELLLLVSASILLNFSVFKITKKIAIFYLINVLLLLSLLILNTILFDKISFKGILQYYLFSFGIINIIFLLFTLKIPKILKIFFWLGFVLLPVLFVWGYYFISKSWFLTADTLLALLQTNLTESCEYIYVNANFTLVLFLIIVFWGIIRFYKSNLLTEFSGFTNKSIIFVLILLNIFIIYKSKDCFIISAINDVKIYSDRINDFRDLKDLRKSNLIKELKIDGKNNYGVYVLIIGESQNRNHMNLYGYNRDNTPYLSQIKNSSNFLMFTNAYSCHTHTVPTLTYALTAKNQYNDLELQKAVSLIEVAEAAGYDTVWISNQVKYSMWDTPITLIADEANQQFWINSTVGENTNTVYYDDKLVEQLKNIKYSKKMLIVFHLMGNHGSYKERYPKSFNKYSENNIIDQYDNSILFNDYVVKNILDNVKNIDGFKGMLYFSDHADAVDQGLAHDSNKFVRDMTEIPLFMYFSDKYIADNRFIFDTLKKSQDKYITNDLIFNTMLGIMGISIENLYEDCNDITNEKYDFQKERFKTMYGVKAI